MFTGIIEEIGKIEDIAYGAKSMKVTVKAKKVLEGVKEGDSINTNGVCLTVVTFDKSGFTADVMPETMRLTNLGKLAKGSPVNLERALLPTSRMGGHIVSGHIDGMGTISGFREEDNATWVTVETPQDILKYIIGKGSIAIDGTSLTVVDTDDKGFRVSIIPTTKEDTTLLKKSPGDRVNLECDVVGKYIERFLTFKEVRKAAIDMDFLKENGFI